MKKKQALFLLIILVITLLAVAGFILLRVYGAPGTAMPTSAKSIIESMFIAAGSSIG